MMHENSLNAWKEENLHLNKKCLEVLKAIIQLGSPTDLEIMQHLGYTDPNKVRPRITDLKKAEVIEELAEKKKNPESGRLSRMVQIKQNPPNPPTDKVPFAQVDPLKDPGDNKTYLPEIKPEPVGELVQGRLFDNSGAIQFGF